MCVSVCIVREPRKTALLRPRSYPRQCHRAAFIMFLIFIDELVNVLASFGIIVKVFADDVNCISGS